MADTGPLLNQDATIWRGGSFRLRWDLVDADGEPLNMAGTELYYRVAQNASSTTPVLALDDVDIETEGSTAITPLTSERTEQIPARTWYHELGWIDSAGERNPLATGRLTSLHAQAAKVGA